MNKTSLEIRQSIESNEAHQAQLSAQIAMLRESWAALCVGMDVDGQRNGAKIADVESQLAELRLRLERAQLTAAALAGRLADALKVEEKAAYDADMARFAAIQRARSATVDTYRAAGLALAQAYEAVLSDADTLADINRRWDTTARENGWPRPNVQNEPWPTFYATEFLTRNGLQTMKREGWG